MGQLQGVLGQVAEKRLFEYGESVTHDGYRVTTLNVVTFRFVRYRDDSGEMAIWNPGPDHRIAVATFRAERLRLDRPEWPARADFQLVTQTGIVDPRLETPDGHTVYSITIPSGRRIRRPAREGLEAHFRRQWDAVYVIEDTGTSQLTTKWIGPAEPVFWMPKGR